MQINRSSIKEAENDLLKQIEVKKVELSSLQEEINCKLISVLYFGLVFRICSAHSHHVYNIATKTSELKLQKEIKELEPDFEGIAHILMRMH